MNFPCTICETHNRLVLTADYPSGCGHDPSNRRELFECDGMYFVQLLDEYVDIVEPEAYEYYGYLWLAVEGMLCEIEDEMSLNSEKPTSVTFAMHSPTDEERETIMRVWNEWQEENKEDEDDE